MQLDTVGNGSHTMAMVSIDKGQVLKMHKSLMRREAWCKAIMWNWNVPKYQNRVNLHECKLKPCSVRNSTHFTSYSSSSRRNILNAKCQSNVLTQHFTRQAAYISWKNCTLFNEFYTTCFGHCLHLVKHFVNICNDTTCDSDTVALWLRYL